MCDLDICEMFQTSLIHINELRHGSQLEKTKVIPTKCIHQLNNFPRKLHMRSQDFLKPNPNLVLNSVMVGTYVPNKKV